MHQINFDKRHSLFEVKLGGLMTIGEVGEYIADLRRIFVEHALRSYSMVIDVTDCPIQSQDMVIAMGAHMATMPKASALAVVTGSSLARMQVRRLFTQPYARTCETVAEGRSWVLSGVEPGGK